MHFDSSFGCVVFIRSIVRRPNLEVTTNKPIHWQLKITEVLVPCLTWKRVPAAISGGVDISDAPGCQLLHEVNSEGG